MKRGATPSQKEYARLVNAVQKLSNDIDEFFTAWDLAGVKARIRFSKSNSRIAMKNIVKRFDTTP